MCAQLPRAPRHRRAQRPTGWAFHGVRIVRGAAGRSEIDVIYNPLPNHLHVPLTIQAAEAGKHVLCEKPLSMTLAEAEALLAVRDRTGVVIGEAFMIRSHPQWLRVRQLLDEGRIGPLRSVVAAFSAISIRTGRIFAIDPRRAAARSTTSAAIAFTLRVLASVRSRRRVVGLIDQDPDMHTDRLTSAILDFPAGPGYLHVQHTAGAVPAGPFSGHARAHRDRDSLQCSDGSPDTHPNR